jgi:hypothetical protein
MYPVSYHQGVSYTVHLDDRDLIFERRGAVYVADMSDWVQPTAAAMSSSQPVYTSKEMAKAKTAWEFIAKAGYPSETEAVHMALDGNVLGLDITGDDVRRAFKIFGTHAAAVKGKATRPTAARQAADGELKDRRRDQELFTDVMKVGGRIILITVSRPLMLTVVTPCRSETTEDLGRAFQDQLALFRGKGFNPVKAHMDPQPALAALVPHFPSVEMDVTGAGDHLDVVDAKIRRIKEIIRSTHASLPWRLPGSLVHPLARYAAARVNARRTTAALSNVAPRVAFTGRKIPAKEFEIAFGDYVECYDPACVSNDALQDRTESCIALYPVGNDNNSWLMFNVRTGKMVRRTSWKKLATTQIIIDAMNAHAERDPVKRNANGDLAEDGDFVAPPSDGPLRPPSGQSSAPIGAEPDEVPRTPSAETAGVQRPTMPPPSAEAIDTGAEMAAGSDVDSVADDQREEDDGIGALTGNESGLAETTQEVEDREGDEAESETDNEQEMRTTREILGARRSARIVAGVRRPCRYCNHLSVKKGIQQHGKAAVDAVAAELIQLFRTKGALIPVLREDLDPAERRNIIRSSMFLKAKYSAQGIFEKIKARLVADGSTQDRELYPDNNSPTVAVPHLMTMLVVAAKERRHVMKIDIGGAYLNAEMVGESVIMEINKEVTGIIKEVLPEIAPFVRDGKLLVKLKKALYGCIQSAKLWYLKLQSVLEKLGF